VVSFSLFYSLKKRELQCRKELKLIFLSVNIGCDTKFLKCLYLEFLAMKFPRLLAQIYHFIHLLKKFQRRQIWQKKKVKKNYPGLTDRIKERKSNAFH